MKRRLTIRAVADIPTEFPAADALAALRASYEGTSSLKAVHSLRDRLSHSQSSRGIIGEIRRQLALYARNRRRADLATLFECSAHKRICIMRAPPRRLSSYYAPWPHPPRRSGTTLCTGCRIALSAPCMRPASGPWPISQYGSRVAGSGGSSFRASARAVRGGSRSSLPRTRRSRNGSVP